MGKNRLPVDCSFWGGNGNEKMSLRNTCIKIRTTVAHLDRALAYIASGTENLKLKILDCALTYIALGTEILKLNIPSMGYFSLHAFC